MSSVKSWMHGTYLSRFRVLQLLVKRGEQDSTCGRKRVLNLEQYEYWREDVEALFEIFEWSAFWEMVMVAFLTLVSIPCSIFQAVYSIKSYRLALAQTNDHGRDAL
jgi:hypothetical protein